MKFKVKVIFVRPFNWPFLKFMCICIHFNRHLKALTCSSCTVYSLQNTISGQLINAAKSQYKETIIHAAQYACVRLPWGGEHLTWGLYEAQGITWSGPAKAFGVGELMKCLARDSRLIFKLVSIAFVCNVNSRIITTCEGSYWGIALTLLFFSVSVIITWVNLIQHSLLLGQLLTEAMYCYHCGFEGYQTRSEIKAATITSFDMCIGRLSLDSNLQLKIFRI